jgi:hypothetical protein
MFKVFIDDSHMNQPPTYVLGGWLAPAKVWAPFSDDWDKILRMSPRIQYFKYDEALGFSGEFRGMSKASRDEKLNLLINLIAEYKLPGVASFIPRDIFQRYFGSHPDRDIRTPYVPSVMSIISAVLNFLVANDIKEKVEFCFDYQPGSVEVIQASWNLYRRVMPVRYSALLPDHPPSFLNDRDVNALQAADFHAGYAWQLDAADLQGKEIPEPIWGDRGDEIQRLSYVWNEETAQFFYKEIFGVEFNATSSCGGER